MDSLDSIKWPEMTPKRLDKINSVFESYLFYRQISQISREVTCTRCGETYIVSRDDYQIYTASHNEHCVKCPKCGCIGTAKSIGKSKGRKNLWAEERVVFITRKSYNKVILQCYECWKSYDGSLTPRPNYFEASRYILTPGNAEKYKQESWYRTGFYKCQTAREPFFVKPTVYYAREPADNSYMMFGTEQLENTYLKYNMLNDYLSAEWQRYNHWIGYFEHEVSYLCRLSERPQVEMLQKLGHNDFVIDLVYNNVKNKCNYRKMNPAEFFRLSKEEYKRFAEYKTHGVTILSYYRMLKKAGINKPMDEAIKCLMEYQFDGGYYLDKFLEFIRLQKIEYAQEIKYLEKQITSGRRIYDRHIIHKDYLEAARKIKFDLKVHNVKFPKDLKAAHDEAYRIRDLLEAEKKAKENKKKEAAAAKRLKEYDKQYAFSDEQYVIIVPHTAAEIVKEGKDMHHCVGGYAGRHLDGKLTICFLRSADAPDKSLYTIEMHGEELTQVQGEGNHTPLTNEARAFFEKWLNWVKAGSPRTKEGNPKILNLERIGA